MEKSTKAVTARETITNPIASIPQQSSQPSMVRTPEVQYVTYGTHFLLKCRSNDTHKDDTLGKCNTPQSSYPYLRCTNNKKNKLVGNSSIFRIHLKQQGPIKLKKTSQVMAIFIGEMGKPQDSATLRNLLGNPRDLFHAKSSSSKNGNHRSTEMRRNFVYVYDTVPLDATNPIDPLECEECNLVEILETEYFPELALSVTFKL